MVAGFLIRTSRLLHEVTTSLFAAWCWQQSVGDDRSGRYPIAQSARCSFLGGYSPRREACLLRQSGVVQKTQEWAQRCRAMQRETVVPRVSPNEILNLRVETHKGNANVNDDSNRKDSLHAADYKPDNEDGICAICHSTGPLAHNALTPVVGKQTAHTCVIA
jgi:hypothetical protein